MSSVGLRSKNPTGSSRKPARATGMIGQSSGRTKCVVPTVYQSTTSLSSSGRSASLHCGRPTVSDCAVGIAPGRVPLGLVVAA